MEIEFRYFVSYRIDNGSFGNAVVTSKHLARSYKNVDEIQEAVYIELKRTGYARCENPIVLFYKLTGVKIVRKKKSQRFR